MRAWPEASRCRCLTATLSDGALLRRGVMNRLVYVVENHEKAATGPMQLKVRVADRDHTTEPFTLGAGETRSVPVVVGGYPDLPDVASLTTTLEITPNAGEKASIVRNGEIMVADGMLLLQILNEPFTRGGTGKVRFTLENTGEEEIEILTARSAGASASNQVTYYLKDRDGNVISSKAFKQVLGQGIVTLSNGNTVARVAAGEVFTSEAMEIPVAANAPDALTVELGISKIYYHQGRVDQVTMNGLNTTQAVTLKETSYYGEIVSISPQSSKGDQDIVIEGRSVGRETGLPMAGVALDLVITVKGFNRTYRIFTDTEGNFSYSFKPLSGESGIYQVRGVHPELLDRPVQGQFVINRVSITPGTINLSVPRNYQKTVNIQVTTGEGTTVNHLRLAYDEADQPNGVFPQGVHAKSRPRNCLAWVRERRNPEPDALGRRRGLVHDHALSQGQKR